MRLFTAIDLPPNVLLRLDRLMAALRPEAFIKWSPIDNLHITTKFIGEWPENRLEEIHAALLECSCAPFPIEVGGLGWFPNDRSPRVLFAGITGCSPLQELARQIEDRLASLGIAKETRDFSPHLTLARIKSPVPLGGLRAKVQEIQPARIGDFQASKFSLFRSVPGSNASIYRSLRDYRFEVALAASPQL